MAAVPHAPRPDPALVPDEHPFAQYLRTLGRGPGRSRGLTRDEARDALGMVLRGETDPHQVGAFLMLLRYRGEDPAEIAGLVEAVRTAIGPGLPPGCPPVALSRAGHRVLMHGSNESTRGTPVTQSLAALGLPVCRDRHQAAAQLGSRGFAYMPLATLCQSGHGLEQVWMPCAATETMKCPCKTEPERLGPRSPST